MTREKHIDQFSTFYAVRPELLNSDEERAEFAVRHPDLVEKFADCWPSPAGSQANQEASQADRPFWYQSPNIDPWTDDYWH